MLGGCDAVLGLFRELTICFRVLTQGTPRAVVGMIPRRMFMVMF